MVAVAFEYECAHRTLVSVYLLSVDIFIAKLHNQHRRRTVRRGHIFGAFIIFSLIDKGFVNLLKPTGYVMHQQFNIQQLYALPTLYLCVLYLSENKQRLVPLTA